MRYPDTTLPKIWLTLTSLLCYTNVSAGIWSLGHTSISTLGPCPFTMAQALWTPKNPERGKKRGRVGDIINRSNKREDERVINGLWMLVLSLVPKVQTSALSESQVAIGISHMIHKFSGIFIWEMVDQESIQSPPLFPTHIRQSTSGP